MSNEHLLEVRNNGAEAAIIFLHGFSGNLEATWRSFYGYVIDDPLFNSWDVYSLGYPSNPMPGVNWWRTDPPISMISKFISAQVTHLNLAKYKVLKIVAHSMGGLVAQSICANSLEVAGKVAGIIHYGTPSNGLKKAKLFGFLNPQIRDMKWKSPFIMSLRGEWDKLQTSSHRLNFLSVAGMSDDFVPEQSSLAPFPKENHFVIPGDHLEIVRPQSSHSYPIEAFKVLFFGGDYSLSPSLSAAQAVERKEFEKAIELYRSCYADLDNEAFRLYALALDSLGFAEKAINVLEESHERGTDFRGILAGRYKRRWRNSGRSMKDADRACELYLDAYKESESNRDYGQCYYHAINLAFMEFVYRKDKMKAARWARQAKDYAENDLYSAWALATCAEALIYMGDIKGGLEVYDKAFHDTRFGPRELMSMLWQLSEINELMRNEDVERWIASVTS
ncbi:tetratricopeptide repeat-containing protein [Maridesulfovibrio zosterae]|uniref:tetratricopeptide repeat-containing protein n=1 Tax=Maridesulfovibrio zosterae TaxID=82171 RepID=UPI0003F4C719|nr:tetratricopeptide repeat-containing protein [Maridesulfovibrio zosterae]